MDNLKSKRNIKAFDGERYSIWKFRIPSLLTELKVIHVIDEEIPEGTQSEEWIKLKPHCKRCYC